MSYLVSNLGRGEEIISKGEVGKAAIIPTAIISGLCFFIPFFLIGLVGREIGFVLIAFIEGIIMGAICSLPAYLMIKNTELGLTNKKILGKYGVINTKAMDSPIGKVNSVTVEQGLGGKIFGYAKIVISTSSGGYTFNYIKNADSFRAAVMEQIDIAEEEKLRKQAEQLAGAMK